MGTSSSYGGPSGASSLVPSWLGTGGGEIAPFPETPESEEDASSFGQGEAAPAAVYRGARTNFTRFARSGGQDQQALKRAIGQYVSSTLGGSATATRRMGTSVPVGAGLLNLLSTAVERGAPAALRRLDIQQMVGLPIEDIFVELMDRLCPADGSIDSAIAREAFAETIADLAAAEVTDFERLDLDQIRMIFELYVAHSIELRIFNDIGVKGVSVPQDHNAALVVQQQLHEYILGAVKDAMSDKLQNGAQLSEDEIARIVREVYQSAFDIVNTLSSDEEE